MKKQQQIPLLRTTYWIGAILDALTATLFLLPNFWASFDQLTTYTASASLTFALGIASAMMFSWTFLPIWADRKPVERKGVLLLTILPLSGLILNNISAVVSGLRPLQATLPEFTLQFTLVGLFTFSYLTVQKET
jgi:hypothetical protein